MGNTFDLPAVPKDPFEIARILEQRTIAPSGARKLLMNYRPKNSDFMLFGPTLSNDKIDDFHFWSGEFVYLCEDGTRAGLVTNGVGIPSHPELARREQQLA